MNPSSSSSGIAPVRVACCQIEPQVGHKASNLAKTADFIERAAKGGARIVVLPELCSSGYVFESRSEARSLADAFDDGASTTLWAGLARDLGLHIVAGFAERAGSTLYNAAAVIGPAGRLGVFRKVHLWSDEHLFFASGNLGFPVFATEHGTLGVGICYDGWFPEVARTLKLQGADLILDPTCWVLVPGVVTPEDLGRAVLTLSEHRIN